MPVPAISPGLFPTALLLDAPQPAPPEAPDTTPRLPDAVVFSSAPFRLLADLAVAGLRQLATLLPTIEQAAQDGAGSIPLGHLAKAAGTAARQVADGHLALLAQGPDRVAAALPGASLFRTAAIADPPAPTLRSLARSVGTTPDMAAPPRVSDELRAMTRRLGVSAAAPMLNAEPAPADPAQRWLAEAKHLLRRTGDVLASIAEAQPDPAPPAPGPVVGLPINWALLEVAAARNEIAAALTRLGDRSPPAWRTGAGGPVPALLLNRLPEAASLLGFALLLLVAGVATGTWTLSAAVAALVGTGVCLWRIYRATRGIRLDGRP